MELTDIKNDIRGTILKFKLGDQKFLVIFTNRGTLRAGELHNIEQHSFLIKGKMEVIMKVNNEDIRVDCVAHNHNAHLVIPKEVPHYFRFLEDSIMIENDDENMTTAYYPEYRKLVEKSLIDSH